MHAYDTIALIHYWGFKWIAKLKLNLFWLAVFLFSVVFVMGFAAEKVLEANTFLGGGTT